VDNDADVYVNGHLLQHAKSGNCNSGGISVDVPARDLKRDNVLAIRGHDYGNATYLDVQVTYALVPDYALAFDWKSTTVASSPVQGWDPLNMIIIPEGKTNITQGQLAAAMSWSSVGIGRDLSKNKCMSEQDAAVQPGNARRSPQDFSWRGVTGGCKNPALYLPKIIRNHARGYYQRRSGAWFLAVSEEKPCLVRGHLWHCITPTGYDRGRDQLVAVLKKLAGYSVRVTYVQAYPPGEPPESRSDPFGPTPYDGRVAVITIAKLPSTAPPPVIP
jgi:hypothetical protein